MPFQEKFNVSNFHTLFLQKWVWKTLALCCIGCGEEASRKLLSPTSDQTDIYSAEPTEGLKIWNYVVGKICPLVLIGSTDLPKYGGGGGKCPLVPMFHRPCSDIYSSIFLFFLLELSRWPLGQHRSYNAHYIRAHTGQEKQCERLRFTKFEFRRYMTWYRALVSQWGAWGYISPSAL